MASPSDESGTQQVQFISNHGSTVSLPHSALADFAESPFGPQAASSYPGRTQTPITRRQSSYASSQGSSQPHMSTSTPWSHTNLSFGSHAFPYANHRHRGMPYIAVDPYTASITHSIQNLGKSTHDDISNLDELPEVDYYERTLQGTVRSSKGYPIKTYLIAFLLDTLPRLLYCYILLCLPSLYFSRVARVFEDADMTMPEIRRMALELANLKQDIPVHRLLFATLSSHSPPTSPYWSLKTDWESFIDSLLREWKTLNVVSVLLLTAILTVLQIQVASDDPLIRYSALLSLICALMSLLYGCIFTIRFAGMKKLHKAAEWAWEARKTKTDIWWNVWVMLAMPSVWLSWSTVAYIICIMTLVWRTGSTSDSNIQPLPPSLAFWPRLIISLMLGLGVVYFALIADTLRRYGSSMDKRWRDRVQSWTERQVYEQPLPEHISPWPHPTGHSSNYPLSGKMGHDVEEKPAALRSHSPFSLAEYEDERAYYIHPHVQSLNSHEARMPNTLTPESAPVNDSPLLKPIATFKCAELHFMDSICYPLPRDIENHYITQQLWDKFLSEVKQAWDDPLLPDTRETTPVASVLRTISYWNANVFSLNLIEAILCREYYLEWPESPMHSVYLVHRFPSDGRILGLDERFGPVPQNLTRIDILDFSQLQHNWITIFPQRDAEVHFNTEANEVIVAESPKGPTGSDNET